jgi:hypothetical protein
VGLLERLKTRLEMEEAASKGESACEGDEDEEDEYFSQNPKRRVGGGQYGSADL